MEVGRLQVGNVIKAKASIECFSECFDCFALLASNRLVSLPFKVIGSSESQLWKIMGSATD